MVYELFFQTWLPIASLILLISLAFISFFYMIARALDHDDFKKWAQNEIYQVFASAFLLGSAVLMISIVNNIMYQAISLIDPSLSFICGGDSCTFNKIKYDSNVFLGNEEVLGRKVQLISQSCGNESNPCQIAIAKAKLDQIYDVFSYYLANKVTSLGWVSLLSGTIIGYGSFQAAPLAGLSNIVNIYTTFIKMAFNFLMILKSNSIFLTFIAVSLFPSFIIAGIALRSISLLRSLGGLLFSIAIGTYFIYPMLLIFSMTLMAPSSDSFLLHFSDESKFVGVVPALPDSTGAAGEPTYISSESSFSEENLTWISKMTNFLYDYVFRILIVKTEDGGVIDSISYLVFRTILDNGFIDSIATFSVWFMIPFIISLYGMLIFIKEFSQFVGGDIDIAGLSKLI